LNLPPAASQVEFSADGKLLLAVGSDRVVAAWHVGDTPEKLELAGHDGAVPTVAFSPDGKFIASAGKDRKVKIWSTRSGAILHTGEGHEDVIESVAFSPDGMLLASGDYSGGILFWHPETGREVGRVNSAYGTVWRLQFDLGGRYVAAAVWKGVATWSIRQQQGRVAVDEFLFLKSEGGVLDMAIHPMGSGIVWRDSKAGLIAYDLLRARRRPLPGSPLPYLRTLHFGPHGDYVRFAADGERLGVVGWSGNRPAGVLDVKVIGTVAGSPDGRWLATLDPAYRRVIVCDFASGREWATLPPQAAEIWALSWSPDGTRVAAGQTDGGIVVWDLEQVRARLAEFGIEVPSTVARTPAGPPSLPPTSNGS
jgi:WD40 repeat protein